MSNLNVPARVTGTGELREVMTRVAFDLRQSATQVEALRKQVTAAVREQLVLDGEQVATATGVADDLGHVLRGLDHALNTAASFAQDVSQQTDQTAKAGARIRAKRNAALLHGERN
jgi:hypothetical protein